MSQHNDAPPWCSVETSAHFYFLHGGLFYILFLFFLIRPSIKPLLQHGQRVSTTKKRVAVSLLLDLITLVQCTSKEHIQ